MRIIHLNSDVGEYESPELLACETELMSLITSANIACGAHARNQDLMRRTARLAGQYGTEIGAHRGFPETQNFGRRDRQGARRVMRLQLPQMIVVKGGWLTTVQDLGRYGSQQYGVSVSGVMDSLATIVANRLVGNLAHAAALEITLKGPELHFEQDTVIAITGADLSAYHRWKQCPTVGTCHHSTWKPVVLR